MKKNAKAVSCPCGGSAYETCCMPILQGIRAANSPEELMRSRYSAYVARNEAYLLETWAPEHRPGSCLYESEVKWLGLNIVSSKVDQVSRTGQVEFVARFKLPSQPAVRLHELSDFEHRDGRWLYVKGEIFS